MRVLAIDTALDACSVAVVEGEEVLAVDSRSMARGHAEALVPALARLASAVGLDGCDRIAVTVGPGSFTGLRVGLSAARALALAGGKPAVGITTLAALAAPVLASDPGRTVVVAIDARHGQVWLQMFDPGGATLVAPCQAQATAAAVLCGTAAQGRARVAIVGSGAGLVTAAWPTGLPAPVRLDGALPDIAWVARLGAAADPAQALPRPLYLREPDARPQDAARIARRQDVP